MTIKESLQKFIGQGYDMKLQKTGSKRSSMVGVGQYETGDVQLMVFEDPRNDMKEAVQVIIINPSLSGDFLRTSPVVKVVDQTEDRLTFETEGGIYALQKL